MTIYAACLSFCASIDSSQSIDRWPEIFRRERHDGETNAVANVPAATAHKDQRVPGGIGLQIQSTRYQRGGLVSP